MCSNKARTLPLSNFLCVSVLRQEIACAPVQIQQFHVFDRWSLSSLYSPKALFRSRNAIRKCRTDNNTHKQVLPRFKCSLYHMVQAAVAQQPSWTILCIDYTSVTGCVCISTLAEPTRVAKQINNNNSDAPSPSQGTDCYLFSPATLQPCLYCWKEDIYTYSSSRLHCQGSKKYPFLRTQQCILSPFRLRQPIHPFASPFVVWCCKPNRWCMIRKYFRITCCNVSMCPSIDSTVNWHPTHLHTKDNPWDRESGAIQRRVPELRHYVADDEQHNHHVFAG